MNFYALNLSKNANGARIKSILTSGHTPSTKTARIGGKNIALQLLPDGRYALACIVDGSATPSTYNTYYKGICLNLAKSNGSDCLYVEATTDTQTEKKTLLLEGSPVAVSDNGALILATVAAPIQEDFTLLGNKNIRVSTTSGKTYLVVAQ